MSALDDIRAERLKKLEILKAAGIDPYPAHSERTHEISTVLTSFDVFSEEGTSITLVGRVMSLRDHGNSLFMDLFDGTGRIQAYVKKDLIGEETYRLFVETVDRGDFIEVTGTSFTTRQGEKSVQATNWRMLTKSLLPIPTEWFGLSDDDERYRLRYLDILLNEKSADLARKRSIFWNTIRTYLLERDFIEVETPILENTTGGADARPFETHHNALDIDLFLRISAGELWQKKLLVAGLPKVFEIGRIFRNEGMSREHLQDYTQLEFYQAYSDYEEGKGMIMDLYRTVAEKTFGTLEFTIGEHSVNLADDWQTYDFCALLKEHYGIDPLATTARDVEKALKKADIPFESETMSIERGVDLLWKKIRKAISGPGFLIGVPVYLEPLAKRDTTNPNVVQRFQVLLAGSEMGKAFSELNDPIDQRERFARQQELREAGDEEAHMPDMDFVEALEYGMPPALGFGLSERLFSFLAGVDVREGQLFPLMRPREK
jgi:lysyl-tRNA synthetase class 2